MVNPQNLLTVECDPDHVYRVNGIIKPGTNQVLNVYFPPSPFYTEAGRDLGAARHLWFDFLARALEPAEDPDPRIAGEVAGFKRWLEDYKPLRHGGETPLYDAELGVCGTPDWWGMVEGRLAIVDFKPKAKNKRTPVQTASYQHNLLANGVPVVDRYELRLGDGTYRFEPHEDDEDVSRWEAMVYGYHAAGFYR